MCLSVSSSLLPSPLDSSISEPTSSPSSTSASTTIIDLFEDLESCAGVDDIYHRVFITSNEKKQEETLSKLKALPITGNTIVGIANFFTLNAASVRGSLAEEKGSEEINTILMIDRGLRVENFWMNMQFIIHYATNRHETLERTVHLIRKEAKNYFAGGKIETPELFAEEEINRLHGEIKLGGSWLSTDTQFDRIQKIFHNNRFIFKRLDLFDTKSIVQLSDIMKTADCVTDLLYVSNVSEYCELSHKALECFIQSTKHLIATKTLVLHTRARPCVSCIPLNQCVSHADKTSMPDLFMHPPYEKPRDLCGGTAIYFTKENQKGLEEMTAALAVEKRS